MLWRDPRHDNVQPHRPRHRVVHRARRPDRRGARVPPLRRQEPRRATCSGSTTTGRGHTTLEQWDEVRERDGAGAGRRGPGAADERARSRPSPRSTRRCASRCARSSRRRSAPTRPSGRRRASSRATLFTRMGELGFLGLNYPEEYGGQGGDARARRGVRRGDGALRLGRRRGRDRRAHRHRDAADPEVRDRGAEAALAGSRRSRASKIGALAITEPGARLGRRGPEDVRPPRQRRVRRERLEDVHHQRRARATST